MDEVASNVGLGWSLTSTGVISRSILGLPDESLNWLMLNKYLNNQLTEDEKIAYVNGIAEGTIDAQPDIYFVSIGSLMCRFVAKNDSEWEILPRNTNLKIQKNINGFMWILTDERGIKYKFNEAEVTTSTTTNISNGQSSDGYYGNATSTWFLSEIEDPNGQKVNFLYEQFGSNLYTRSSESVTVPTDPGGLNIKRTDQSYTLSTTSTKFLTHVTYANGSIEFIPSTQERLDSEDGRMISTLKIREGNNLRHFNFFYSYFQANNIGIPLTTLPTDKYRLKLDSLKEVDANNKAKPPYVFTYAYTSGLPYRNSYAQDHWGYYNGQANTISVSYAEQGVRKGANKTPNPTFSIGGSLTKIKYPTGGDITFDYEGNKYYAESFQSLVDTTLIQLNGNNAPSSTDFHFQVPFDVKSSFLVNGLPLDVVPEIYIEGVTSSCSCTLATYITGGPSNQTISIRDNYPIKLYSGNYVLHGHITNEFEGNPYVYFSIHLKAQVTSITGGRNMDGPGVRVSKITKNFNGATENIHFNYLDPVTGRESGQVGNVPYYASALTISTGSGVSPEHTHNNIVYSSTSNYPLIGTQSAYVGYSTVTVTKDANGSTGKSVFWYTNYRNYNDYNLVYDFPFPPASPLDWRRGLLIKQEEYKKEGSAYVPVKRYTYNFDVEAGSLSMFKALKVGTFHVHNYSASGATRYSGRTVLPYDIGTDAFVILRDTLIEDVGNGLRVISDYSYNTKYLLTSKHSSNSDGSKEVMLTTYPDDYATGTAFIDNMKSTASHLVAYPIEQVRYREVGTTRTILSGKITKYLTGGKGRIDQVLELETLTPLALSAFKFSNRAAGQLPPTGGATAFAAHAAYAVRLTYGNYDAFGNPQQVTPTLGTPTTYIWSYGGQYPIAEIKNASFATVQTALGGAAALTTFTASSPAEADLRNKFNGIRASLPNSSLTYYTYNPLIGMTSSTDPTGRTTYYDYDGSGRLQTVKDTQQKTKEAFNYNYRNQ